MCFFLEVMDGIFILVGILVVVSQILLMLCAANGARKIS